MKDQAHSFDQAVILILGLHEPMEPKHRDIAVIEEVGSGYRTRSFNLPSTQLLETRIGYLAREALNEMTAFIYSRLGDGIANSDSQPPIDLVRSVRDGFAKGDVRVEVILGTVRNGTNSDADNCLKIVMDALTPVLFPNDRHVTVASVTKTKSAKDASGIAPTWVMITREGEEKTATGAYVFPARNALTVQTDLPVLNAPS